ncbi:MAG: response regulator, partial [Anaerolineales bacterium]|nr:response regulator [Anaerolineales bacterium]
RNEGWVLVIRDVTSERLLQQHIHQQERLAAVGQMAAGIAHDFNNIMAVIVLYTQMLQRSSELGPRSMERLNTINEQAEHATDLIQQILDFSRRSLLKRQPLDLEPFIREQVRIFERTLPESIEIKYTFGVDDYTVNADATRIQQALMNLAVNARDAMINGGELTIQLDRIYIHHPRNAPLPEMSESAGDWIKITVTDNGTGIPPEAVDHIFEPFFTTKEVGKGSGLGLAQVYGIIKQHDGHMEVETDIGQGTSFIIYMPALVDKKQFVIESNDSSIYHGSGETILIVEDNSATRDALVASVESINYRALQAANGKEAIQILEQDSRISMMLTDLVMPEMGGIELLEQLRQCWPHVPVVLLTGYPLGDQFESFANQGICAWLQKPVSLDKLSSTISKVIKQKKDRPTFVA